LRALGGFLLLVGSTGWVATRGSLPAATGVLAFESDRGGQRDVYLIETDASGLKRLTDHGAEDGGPAWSPDGKRIAFHSNRAGNFDIYLMDADGSHVERLTDHPADESQPHWSPDGRWIAFESERDGTSEIYRVRPDTKRVRRLTDSPSRKLGPAHSPDGHSIAYMDGGLDRWQVALLDLGSGESRYLTRRGGNCRPSWSPDGRLLALVSTRDSSKADIWLTEVGRAASWKLASREDAHNYDPSFSPDGRALAFASTFERQPEEWDLYLVDVNGRGLTQLTSGPGNDRFPAWRP
jgi:Tol biopolymer transport system component